VPSTEPPDSGPLTVEAFVAIASGLARSLRAAGHAEAAATLEKAAAAAGPDHERLLVVREALVRTRASWSGPDGEGPAEISSALTAAKRLAIDL
jgi:hypothetical protein